MHIRNAFILTFWDLQILEWIHISVQDTENIVTRKVMVGWPFIQKKNVFTKRSSFVRMVVFQTLCIYRKYYSLVGNYLV